MKLKHAVLCLSLFAVFAISFNASAEKKAKKDSRSKKMSNSEKAKKILEKAEKAEISFIKTFVQKKKNTGVSYKTEIKEWKKYHLDGTSVERKDLTVTKLPGKVITKSFFLKKADGSFWNIIGDIAIKNNWYKPRSPELFKERVKRGNGEFNYKVTETVFNKKPCFKVLVTDKLKRKPKDFIKSAIFYIDKQDFFIYHVDFFTAKGIKLDLYLPVTIEKVKNNNISDLIFQVPKNARIVIADSPNDYSLYLMVAEVKQAKKSNPNGNFVLEKYLKEKYNVNNIDILLKYHDSKEFKEVEND